MNSFLLLLCRNIVPHKQNKLIQTIANLNPELFERLLALIDWSDLQLFLSNMQDMAGQLPLDKYPSKLACWALALLSPHAKLRQACADESEFISQLVIFLKQHFIQLFFYMKDDSKNIIPSISENPIHLTKGDPFLEGTGLEAVRFPDFAPDIKEKLNLFFRKNPALVTLITGDSFIQETCLEGGRSEESAILTRFYILSEATPGKCTKASNVTPDKKYLLDLLKDFITWKIHILYSLKRDNFDIGSPLFAEIAERAANGTPFLLEGGYTGNPGHCMLYLIQPNPGTNTYTFTVFNTGDGIQYHRSIGIGDSKLVDPILCWKNVPAETIRDPMLYRLLLSMRCLQPNNNEMTHNAERLYTLLYSLLSEPSPVEAGDKRFFCRPQLSSTCSWAVFERALLPFILSEPVAADLALRIRLDGLEALESFCAANPEQWITLFREGIRYFHYDLTNSPLYKQASAEICQKGTRFISGHIEKTYGRYNINNDEPLLDIDVTHNSPKTLDFNLIQPSDSLTSNSKKILGNMRLPILPDLGVMDTLSLQEIRERLERTLAYGKELKEHSNPKALSALLHETILSLPQPTEWKKQKFGEHGLPLLEQFIGLADLLITENPTSESIQHACYLYYLGVEILMKEPLFCSYPLKEFYFPWNGVKSNNIIFTHPRLAARMKYLESIPCAHKFPELLDPGFPIEGSATRIICDAGIDEAEYALIKKWLSANGQETLTFQEAWQAFIEKKILGPHYWLLQRLLFRLFYNLDINEGEWEIQKNLSSSKKIVLAYKIENVYDVLFPKTSFKLPSEFFSTFKPQSTELPWLRIPTTLKEAIHAPESLLNEETYNNLLHILFQVNVDFQTTSAPYEIKKDRASHDHLMKLIVQLCDGLGVAGQGSQQRALITRGCDLYCLTKAHLEEEGKNLILPKKLYKALKELIEMEKGEDLLELLSYQLRMKGVPKNDKRWVRALTARILSIMSGGQTKHAIEWQIFFANEGKEVWQKENVKTLLKQSFFEAKIFNFQVEEVSGKYPQLGINNKFVFDFEQGTSDINQTIIADISDYIPKSFLLERLKIDKTKISVKKLGHSSYQILNTSIEIHLGLFRKKINASGEFLNTLFVNQFPNNTPRFYPDVSYQLCSEGSVCHPTIQSSCNHDILSRFIRTDRFESWVGTHNQSLHAIIFDTQKNEVWEMRPKDECPVFYEIMNLHTNHYLVAASQITKRDYPSLDGSHPPLIWCNGQGVVERFDYPRQNLTLFRNAKGEFECDRFPGETLAPHSFPLGVSHLVLRKKSGDLRLLLSHDTWVFDNRRSTAKPFSRSLELPWGRSIERTSLVELHYSVGNRFSKGSLYELSGTIASKLFLVSILIGTRNWRAAAHHLRLCRKNTPYTAEEEQETKQLAEVLSRHKNFDAIALNTLLTVINFAQYPYDADLEVVRPTLASYNSAMNWIDPELMLSTEELSFLGQKMDVAGKFAIARGLSPVSPISPRKVEDRPSTPEIQEKNELEFLSFFIKDKFTDETPAQILASISTGSNSWNTSLLWLRAILLVHAPKSYRNNSLWLMIFHAINNPFVMKHIAGKNLKMEEIINICVNPDLYVSFNTEKPIPQPFDPDFSLRPLVAKQRISPVRTHRNGASGLIGTIGGPNKPLSTDLIEIVPQDRDTTLKWRDLLQERADFHSQRLFELNNQLNDLFKDLKNKSPYIEDRIYPYSLEEALLWFRDFDNRQNNPSINLMTLYTAIEGLLIHYDSFARLSSALKILNKIIPEDSPQHKLFQQIKELLNPPKYSSDTLAKQALYITFKGRRALRNRQIELAEKITHCQRFVFQGGCGSGKSSVMRPVLAEMLTRLRPGGVHFQVIPSSQLPEEMNNMRRYLLSQGRQQIFHFTHDRDLKFFARKFKDLTLAQNNGDIMMTTIEDLQGLLLSFFEHKLKHTNSKSNVQQILQNALALVTHPNSTVTIDEVHEVTKTLQELNFSVGHPVKMESFRWEIPTMILRTLYRLNRSQVPTVQEYVMLEHRLADAIAESLCPSQKTKTKGYLLTKRFEDARDPIAQKMEKWLAAQPNAESIRLARAYIQVAIKSLLQMRYLVDYGPSARSLFAVPYEANMIPSEMSNFSSYDVFIPLTLLMTLRGGVPEKKMHDILRKWKRHHLTQKPFAEGPTRSEKKFAQLTEDLKGIQQLSLTEVSVEHKELIDQLRFKESVIFDYFEKELLPSSTVQKTILSANAHDLLTVLFDRVYGMTATPTNHQTYPLDLPVDWEPGSEEETIELFGDPTICHYTPLDDISVDALLLEPVHVILDPDSHFEGIAPRQTASEILQKAPQT